MTTTLVIVPASVIGITATFMGGATAFWIGAILAGSLLLVWLSRRRPTKAPPIISQRTEPKLGIYLESLPTPTPQYPRSRNGPLRWVPAGETIDICGYRISSGLIYVCDGEPEPDEASAINSRLPIDTPARGEHAALGYYSQYRFISPAQRGAYLEWLAAGRRDEDPTTRDLGYVFLFIYGLERRLLVDGGQDPEAVSELVRLLSRYGRCRSLRSYVCQLVHFWGWKQGLGYYVQLREWMDTLPVSLLGQDEMAIVLASLYLSGNSLPPGLAYDLTFRNPGARRSVVVRRTENELKELFTKRYLEKFPGGMQLHEASANVHLDYRPASPSLLELTHRQSHIFRLKIPDVLGLSSQFTPLLSIWESCIDDLAGYSRVKAKEGAAVSLKGYLALPEDLRKQKLHPLAAHWETLLGKARRERSCVLISAGEAAEMVEVAERPRLTPTQSRQVAEAIESLGFGVEPDARYTGVGYSWDQGLGVFLPSNKLVTRPSGNCRGAQMLLELCVFIAAADGRVSREELDAGRRFIESQLSLGPEDKERLDVFQETLVNDPGKAEHSLSRIAGYVPIQDRERIAQLLVLIAAADDVVTKDELRALELAFKVLGLPAEKLDDLLKSIRPEFREVSVQPPAARVPGETIPPPLGFKLDMARVAAIAQETKEVIGILAQVMADEEELTPEARPTTPTPLKPPSPKAPTIDNAPTAGAVLGWMVGLDPKYQPLLQKLAERDSWNRGDFDTLAKTFQLMPLDAYDAINEWADEHLGDFLLDGEHPVQINRGLITKGQTTHA